MSIFRLSPKQISKINEKVGLSPNIIVAPTQTFRTAISKSLRALGIEELTQLSLVANSLPIWGAPNLLVLSPALGAPAVRLGLNYLSILNPRRVVLVGTAGVWAPYELSPPIGSICVPTTLSYLSSSQSWEYITELNIDAPRALLVRAKLGFYEVECLSTDVILESDNTVFLGRDEPLLVEMELVGFMAACSKHKLSPSSYFVVSDHIASESIGFFQQVFLDSVQKLVTAVVVDLYTFNETDSIFKMNT